MLKKLLLIDDHPSMITGYKQIFLHNILGHQFEFASANNCQTAYKIISNTTNPIFFDFAIVDYCLPPYPEGKMAHGDDLVVLINKYLPDTKTLIITSHFESILLHNIYLKTNANGIMVKTDVDEDTLLLAYSTIMNGETNLSETAKKAKMERLLTEGHL